MKRIIKPQKEKIEKGKLNRSNERITNRKKKTKT